MKLNVCRRFGRFCAIVLTLSALIPVVSRAQDSNPCESLLREGLYQRLEIKRSSSFDLDLRTYLLNDGFTKDLKTEKWSAGAFFLTDYGLADLNADSSEGQIREFHQKIEKSKKVTIAERSADHLIFLKPNDDLARRYVECVIGTQHPLGFHSEKPTVVDDTIIFKVWFTPIAPGDPPAKVTVPIQVVNARILSGDLPVGSSITVPVNIIAQRSPDRSVVLVLQTDHGVVDQVVPAVSKKEVSIDMPVGTVICSFLTWSQFAAATKCNDMNPAKEWRSGTSKWCPADGREVPSSLYSEQTSSISVPDLRAMFIRGLNSFDVSPPNSVTNLAKEKRDPKEGRPLGDYEEDEFKNHRHAILDNLVFGNGLKGGDGGEFISRQTTTTQPQGGEETRPKNVSAAYYIRIN